MMPTWHQCALTFVITSASTAMLSDRTAAAADFVGFVGDGKYRGDGGQALENLFRAWPWREIRRCPGRYVVGATAR